MIFQGNSLNIRSKIWRRSLKNLPLILQWRTGLQISFYGIMLKNLGCYNRQKTIVDTQLYNSCKMHVQNQQSYIQLEKGRNSIHSL